MGRRALAAWLLLLTYLLAAALPGSLWADPARARASAIVANRGQWDPRARYMADRGAMRIWFSAAGALYDLSDGGGHGHRVMQRFVDASAATPDASGVLPGGWSFIGAGGSAVTLVGGLVR